MEQIDRCSRQKGQELWNGLCRNGLILGNHGLGTDNILLTPIGKKNGDKTHLLGNGKP